MNRRARIELGCGSAMSSCFLSFGNPDIREVTVLMTSTMRAAHSRSARRQVLDAATVLFIDRGLHRTTMDMVASRAGLSADFMLTVGIGLAAQKADGADLQLAAIRRQVGFVVRGVHDA
ncbi:helix-turn-helix domain-containing protein [Nocardia gipuzkoensis]